MVSRFSHFTKSLTEAFERRPWTMATSLNQTPRESYGLGLLASEQLLRSEDTYRAFTRQNNLRGVLRMGNLQKVPTLNTSAKGYSRTLVCSWTSPSLDKVVRLEAVGVDDQRTPAGASPQEIMASVANHKAQVVLPGKVDAFFDMGVCLGHDNVNAVVT